MNKTIAVKNHLIEHNSITSLEAFGKYGATRLSAIIFNLRKEGWVIDTEITQSIDRYNHPVRYATYKLVSLPNEG